MPSWIGPWEIGIVLVIALLIFGPRKLPDLGSSLGKSIRGFRQGMKEGDQDESQETVAEVKETAEVSDAPVAKSEPVETAATSAVAPAAAASRATSQATATVELPKCWGTWEDGHEACLQCSVAADCAESGRQTTVGE
jgi:sec-independent protein translocase protein TatA